MSKHVKALRDSAQIHPCEACNAKMLAAADHLERTEKKLAIARKALRVAETGDALATVQACRNASRLMRRVK